MASTVPECAEDFFYCQICTETFNRPKALPCLHTFCQSCLESYAKAQHAYQTGHFPCPICRKPVVIGVAGVESLPDNFMLNKIADVLRKFFLTKCDICKVANRVNHGNAKFRCLECDKKMCEECGNTHIKVQITSSHSLQPVHGDSENKCIVHENETVKYYCSSHNLCICVACTMLEHISCDIKELQEVKDLEMSLIQDLLSKCDQKISTLENLEEKSSLQIGALREQINDVEMKIASLRQDVDSLENSLEKEQANKCQIMVAIQHLSQLKSYSTSIISQDNPVKFLAVSKQVQQQLVDCLAHDTSHDQTRPKQASASMFSVPCDSIYLTASADTACTTAHKCENTHHINLIRRFATPKLAKDSQFLRVAVTQSGVIALCDCSNEIVKMFDQFGTVLGAQDIKADVMTSCDNNIICINYDYQLSKESQLVILNTHGRIIKEKNIEMTCEPSGIAVSQNKELLVSFDNNTMVYYSLEGKMSQQVIMKVSRTARKGFRSCVPSLLLDDSAIYACDTQQNCINVFNMDGSLIRTMGCHGNDVGELSFPESICFHGNKLLVCDYDNNRISMFHKEGQFLGQLLRESDGICKPKTISLIQDDRLLVVQRNREAIEFLIFQVKWDLYQD